MQVTIYMEVTAGVLRPVSAGRYTGGIVMGVNT
jgi:hypothetical protein